MSRRGSILFGVLLVVVLATLLSATTMHRVRNNTDIVRAATRGDASRSILRSGLRVLLAEFSEARPDLIRGGLSLSGDAGMGDTAGTLRISDGVVVSETGGRRGIVRLIPHPSGELVLAESVRLNINRATREMLMALPEMDEGVADAIVARRSTRLFEAVEELLVLEEMTPRMLFGDLEDWADRYRPADERAGAGHVETLGLAGSPVLADLITVYSADPNVRCGLESETDARAGERRLLFPSEVVVREGDSLRLSDAAAGLVDPGEAAHLEMADGEGALLQRLVSGVEGERWSRVLDAVSMTADPYLIGRVDLTNAGAEVLACLPGIGGALAQEIIARRSGLSARELAGVAWPVEQGILTPEQFVEVAPWLTTRTLQFRFLVEAGFEVTDGSARSGDITGVVLDQRVVAEVVIDVSGGRARIAYIRDVTWLRDAMLLHIDARERRDAAPALDEYDFGDPFAIDMSLFESEDEEDGVERPRDRAQQLREQMRTRRDQQRGPEAEDEGAPAVAAPEGQDRRIGRWNGASRTGSGS